MRCWPRPGQLNHRSSWYENCWSFGRPKLAKGASASEDLAFGLGDLHLPLGWGDIPWDELLPKLAFQKGTVFMLELPWHFEHEAQACAREAERLIRLIGSAR